jgi:hypothetical protein
MELTFVLRIWQGLMKLARSDEKRVWWIWLTFVPGVKPQTIRFAVSDAPWILLPQFWSVGSATPENFVSWDVRRRWKIKTPRNQTIRQGQNNFGRAGSGMDKGSIAKYTGECTVGCSDFHFYLQVWKYLPFPAFPWTQGLSKCKKIFHFSNLFRIFWSFLKNV